LILPIARLVQLCRLAKSSMAPVVLLGNARTCASRTAVLAGAPLGCEELQFAAAIVAEPLDAPLAGCSGIFVNLGCLGHGGPSSHAS